MGFGVCWLGEVINGLGRWTGGWNGLNRLDRGWTGEDGRTGGGVDIWANAGGPKGEGGQTDGMVG